MKKLEIKSLQSVNGVLFGSDKTEVRKQFGSDFEEYPKKEERTLEFEKGYDEIVQRMAKIAGKTVEEFLKGVPPVDLQVFDDYPFGMIDYSDDQIFEAIEIPSDKGINLIVDGINCSDFNVNTFKSLSDDFVWEPQDTSWTSYKKQISLFCPENDKIVECVLFGCPGYYDSLNEE
ncbi:MAG: hypothetical protein J6X54_00260 [Treponema sp.]|nr:hypothetical protein [Treponema sp.]